MPSPSDGAERSALQAVSSGLKRWLDKARDAVMSPWKRFKAQPSADAIAATEPAWMEEVNRILAALDPAIREGWAATDLPGDLNINDPYIQANLALTKNLLVRVPDEVHAMVVNAILKGVKAGEPMEQIAARVQQVLTYTGSEDWPSRAQTIAQTETNRHFNSSMLAHGLLREKQGVRGLQKRWDTRMDGRERAWHGEANNQVRPLLQPFLVGGENLMFPVDPTGRPDNVINCVTGSTHIRAAGVSAAYRFRWCGELITLQGNQGVRLTVSPNHPILSERGWIAAHEVKKNDYLISARFSNSSSGSTPYIQSSPPNAEEIFLALESVGHRKRMDCLAVDFYGDRPNGQVDVVFVDRHLTFGIDSAFSEPFEKFAFTCANEATAFGSTLDQFFLRPSFTTGSGVGSGNLVTPLLQRESLPLHTFGFGLSSKDDAEFNETCFDSTPGHARLNGKRVNGSTCEVLLTQIVDIEILSAPSHVDLYTFQTSSGIYITDDIVSHNCRCELRILGELS